MKKNSGLTGSILVILLTSSIMAMEPSKSITEGLIGLKEYLRELVKSLSALNDRLTSLSTLMNKMNNGSLTSDQPILDLLVEEVNNALPAKGNNSLKNLTLIEENKDNVQNNTSVLILTENFQTGAAHFKDVKASRTRWKGIDKAVSSERVKDISQEMLKSYFPALSLSEKGEIDTSKEEKIRKFITYFYDNLSKDGHSYANMLKNYLKSDYQNLTLCDCSNFPKSTRLLLILMQANDIIKMFKNSKKEDPFVHVTLASGRLLQTLFLVIALRYFGFTNPIKIIAIDPESDTQEVKSAFNQCIKTKSDSVSLKVFKDEHAFFTAFAANPNDYKGHSFDMIDAEPLVAKDSTLSGVSSGKQFSTCKINELLKYNFLVYRSKTDYDCFCYKPYLSKNTNYNQELAINFYFACVHDPKGGEIDGVGLPFSKILLSQLIDSKELQEEISPLRIAVSVINHVCATFKSLVDQCRAVDEPIIYVGAGSGHVGESRNSIEKYMNTYIGLWDQSARKLIEKFQKI